MTMVVHTSTEDIPFEGPANRGDTEALLAADRSLNLVTRATKVLNACVEAALISYGLLALVIPWVNVGIVASLSGDAWGKMVFVGWAVLGGVVVVGAVVRAALRRRGDDLYDVISDKLSQIASMRAPLKETSDAPWPRLIQVISQSLRSYARAVNRGVFFPAITPLWQLFVFLALHALNTYIFFIGLTQHIKAPT